MASSCGRFLVSSRGKAAIPSAKFPSPGPGFWVQGKAFSYAIRRLCMKRSGVHKYGHFGSSHSLFWREDKIQISLHRLDIHFCLDRMQSTVTTIDVSAAAMAAANLPGEVE
jgi:hypothetical protein